jgi:NCAIR mutase (PurE)-related protein
MGGPDTRDAVNSRKPVSIESNGNRKVSPVTRSVSPTDGDSLAPRPLRALFDAVHDGRMTPADAEQLAIADITGHVIEDLGFARVDHDRAARQGFPEVVFGQGKTPHDIARIARAIVDRGHSLLVTRTTRGAFDELAKLVPDATFHERAAIIERRTVVPPGKGALLVAAAGTSDIPVAEETAISAEVMGNEVDRLYDVGVAGLHRLLAERHRLTAARVIVVVAGMEGALASVIGGLVRVPVIAVPTSVGYGASFGGLAALLAMLNSCAAGIATVNIDNGFGAAAMASAINHLE